MALTDTVETGTSPSDEVAPRNLLGSWWVIVGFALLLLLAFGWQLLLHPTWTAPTRDPAWYTWRANLILQAEPGSIAREWGPDAVFSGGYRVTAPLAGALLQRIAGIDQYSFSAFLMVGIPVLAGLALGAAGFRSRRDPLIVLLAMLGAAAMFLTVPYVGYLDDLTMLFLLCVMLAFVAPARTSWGARVALFAIAVATAFTHPTTCVLFGLSLMGVFAWHFVTSRFSLGSALKSDGPMLMSVGFGMIVGLASWLVGIWGPRAKLSDAAAPPPYSKSFFLDRLGEWFGSMKPLITVPLIVVAIVGVILWSRRERKPANQYEIVSIWWLFPFVGTLTFLFSAKPVPYYRFINASAAPVALVGLGAFIAIRWFLRRQGSARVAGVLASVLVVGALGWVFVDGLRHDWTSDRNQWVNEDARTSLAAVHTVAQAAGARPIVLVVNHDNVDDSTGTNTAYGWAKTFTNIFRTGLPGGSARYQATYLGRLEDFLLGGPSTGPSAGYRKISRDYWDEFLARRKAFPNAPLVFVIGQYYGGEGDKTLVQTDGISIGPDVSVITNSGTIPLWTPPADVVAAAQEASKAQAAAFADAPGPLSDPVHLLRVLLGLFLLAILPGLLAAPFFELEDTPSRIALIPGMSIVMTLLAGIAVLTVWRGPLSSTKAWAVVVVAVGAGALLRVGRERVLGVLRSFGNFFNGLFAVFSNRDYSVLMGVQFLAQAGQGVVQGAIAKSIAFGGQKGFDIQTVPSASYLLKVVLALYVPYMLVSPFIGVFIDRFERRRVAWWAMICSAILVAAVAVAVLLPIGKGTTAGKVGATAGLIVGLLVVQAVARVILAVKSAAIPDVLRGIDLMQGNGLSQAGGGLLQVVGIAFGGVAAALLPPWVVVVVGSGVLVVGAVISRQLQHAELHPHATSFAREASQVVRNIVAGLKEVAGRAPAALGLSSFQMLRYQFWGFVLFTWALYAKNLVTGGDADTLSLILSGIGGLAGGALGVVVAQKLKDRVPPVRILLVSMAALGVSVVVFGSLVSVAGFAVLLFLGFFTFFTGKISTDTITQQTMPDDFRGRAFALFDIAYNLGYIVPALILSLVWIENDPTRTRTILVVSGLLFLGLTALVSMWARRIRDQFAPQDDLVTVE